MIFSTVGEDTVNSVCICCILFLSFFSFFLFCFVFIFVSTYKVKIRFGTMCTITCVMTNTEKVWDKAIKRLSFTPEEGSGRNQLCIFL